MARWHHRLNAHEFGWTPGVGDGQGGLACCDSWGHKNQTWLSDWTELNWTDIVLFWYLGGSIPSITFLPSQLYLEVSIIYTGPNVRYSLLKLVDTYQGPSPWISAVIWVVRRKWLVPFKKIWELSLPLLIPDERVGEIWNIILGSHSQTFEEIIIIENLVQLTGK